MEKFHELVDHYERLHDDQEYRPHKVSVSVFYSNFLNRFDKLIGDILNPEIASVVEKFLDKIRYLSSFNERMRLHDLAQRMVERLNGLAVDLYEIPDLEYVGEMTRGIHVNILMECCPEFELQSRKDGKKCVRCKGTVQEITVKEGQDFQAAVRYYYERYCLSCEKHRQGRIENSLMQGSNS
jgi:hypothetical protein